MGALRDDPGGRGVRTGSPLPPVTRDDPVVAQGDRLVGLDRLGARGVVEVRTERHGVLAVGMAGGEPFAVSNVSRSQSPSSAAGASPRTGPWSARGARPPSSSTTAHSIGPEGPGLRVPPCSAAVRASAPWSRRSRATRSPCATARSGSSERGQRSMTSPPCSRARGARPGRADGSARARPRGTTGPCAARWPSARRPARRALRRRRLLWRGVRRGAASTSPAR